MLGPSAATRSPGRLPNCAPSASSAAAHDAGGRAAPPGVHRGHGTRARIGDQDRHAVRHLDGEGAGGIIRDHGVCFRPASARERVGRTVPGDDRDRAAVNLLRPEEPAWFHPDCRGGQLPPAGLRARPPQPQLTVREEVIGNGEQAGRAENLPPRLNAPTRTRQPACRWSCGPRAPAATGSLA